jgi:hypothetical protein
VSRPARRFGGEPQWAVCGESFPVGCRFAREVVCPQFFSVNPDRRRRLYSSAAGMYRPGCGLAAVYMSWSAAEYLYMVCARRAAGPCWSEEAAWGLLVCEPASAL